jgi:hypothetical protein
VLLLRIPGVLTARGGEGCLGVGERGVQAVPISHTSVNMAHGFGQNISPSTLPSGPTTCQWSTHCAATAACSHDTLCAACPPRCLLSVPPPPPPPGGAHSGSRETQGETAMLCGACSSTCCPAALLKRVRGAMFPLLSHSTYSEQRAMCMSTDASGQHPSAVVHQGGWGGGKGGEAKGLQSCIEADGVRSGEVG